MSRGSASSRGVVEILTLGLKRGAGAEFHDLYVRESLPLLRKWRFDVVAHGPSQHDPDIYFVVRRFASLAQRQTHEDAFYGSDDWRNGPRAAVLGMIESLSYVVVPAEALRAWSAGGNTRCQ